MARPLLNPRDIIDRRALVAAVDDAFDSAGDPLAARAEVVRRLAAALERGRAEVRRRFEAERNGLAAAHAHSFLIDQVIRVLFDAARNRVYPLANPTAGERMAMVAVGGYGRRELAPGSDVDILFLLPYKPTPHNEQVVEWILYLLWDLRLKLGYATRSVDDCVRLARGDMTIRTALLEARYLWGDRALVDELRRRYLAEVVEGTALEFVDAKLAERDERHQRMGDSRYVLEPNVKEGKGGLRDLQTLFWIAKYLYRADDMEALVARGVFTPGEARKFEKALEFLWTVRCHLHYVTGRAEERLTFDVQTEIAERMGYRPRAGARPVERFMKHYYLVAKDVGDLTRIFCAAMEAEHRRRPRLSFAALLRRRREVDGFVVEGGWVGVADETVFAADPVRLLRLFHFAQQEGLDIQPAALRLIRRNLRLIDAGLRANPEANRLFMEMLTSRKDPETTLRRLNEAGVFGRFVPDFGRVVAQMQHDMYHVYTVDEHTIRAIGLLHRIEAGELKEDHPLSTEIIHKVLSRRVLYLAVLLHDVAKGRGGDHSVLGAEVAQRLGPRLGLSDAETETVAWLVRHHLAMSNTAQRRDIGDPKTIADFVELVQSPERLRLLLVLTVVDMRATGPHVFNGWKAALLRELYARAEEVMSGGLAAAAREERLAAARAALREALSDWDDERFAAHLERTYPGYWLSLDTETQARHARLVDRAEREGLPLAVDIRVDRARAVTEVTIYAADHPGLFSETAGAIAVSGGNIVDARIHTLANGMALDTYWVQDYAGHAFDRPDRLEKLPALIEQSLAGRLRAGERLVDRRLLPRRAAVFKVPPRVLIDNKASATHTVIEVNGRDRPAFLYDVTRAITELGLQISSAKISTYGERVVDVFYVKDVFGMKIEHEGKLARIREALMAVLERGTEAPPGDVAARADAPGGAARAAAPAAE